MKKIVAAIFLFSASSAFAWEYPKNPDRFPSIGGSLSGTDITGTLSTPAGGVSRNYSATDLGINLDTRLPLSNSFTLGLAVGYSGNPTKSDPAQNGNFHALEDDDNFHRKSVALSGRYYFNN